MSSTIHGSSIVHEAFSKKFKKKMKKKLKEIKKNPHKINPIKIISEALKDITSPPKRDPPKKNNSNEVKIRAFNDRKDESKLQIYEVAIEQNDAKQSDNESLTTALRFNTLVDYVNPILSTD